MRFSGFKPVLKLLIGAALMFVVLAAPARPGMYRHAGTFTLPFDAQWGLVKLSPGTYSLDIEEGRNFQVILRQGTHNVGIITPESGYSLDHTDLQASLLCVRRGSTFSVRTLRLPTVGTFCYSTPKSKNHTVAQQPELIQNVPITVAGK